MYKAAIIGAGRVGSSLGLYFFDNNYISLEGFYSKSRQSASYSAGLTKTKAFTSIKEIVDTCNIIFVTTGDDQIARVWKDLKNYDLNQKIICHCSGSLSSEVFSSREKNYYSASIHPMLAISSKDKSYKDLKEAFFTLEGDRKALEVLAKNLDILYNPYKIIDTKDKSGYHLSTVCISNMVVGLSYMAEKILKTYDFTSQEARKSLEVLAKKNMENIFLNGPIDVLTGPIERADTSTIRSHIDYLEESDLAKEREIYLDMGLLLVEIAKSKNPQRDYDGIIDEIQKRKGRDN